MATLGLKGFMLLPTERTGVYRGVDRKPFEPLIEDDAHLPSNPGPDAISDFYPTGWKRDLYRLAETDSVEDCGFLFSHITTAVAIRDGLATHVEPYEIVWTEITAPPPSFADATEDTIQGQFLGYDLAYLGGDFYSAVLNGLVVNPDHRLQAEFATRLNEFGLFTAREIAIEYLAAFRQSVVTESTSEFYLYSLRLVAQNELARVTRAN